MIELLQQQLDSYNSANPIEEEQATREIFQEVALYARSSSIGPVAL